MGNAFQSTKKVMEIVRGKHFYKEYDLTVLYYQFQFGFPATKIYVVNDSDNYTAQVSFNGTSLNGELKPHEDITLYADDATSIYARITDATGTNNLRVFAA